MIDGNESDSVPKRGAPAKDSTATQGGHTHTFTLRGEDVIYSGCDCGAIRRLDGLAILEPDGREVWLNGR